ncbi:ATP-dependent DNA helicase RecG [Flavobacteriales bacterium]|nr:ATP-dependent DNA helicase RecG [Flavobacteriales bacterium]MDC0015023.1 ATP-dependent DNA helicase RecG [Flavobacteriales bacterium]|tara:strand:- start:1743 stop:3845 length:2103 start_codon:yes stop_codon:yes gene_type:complete
MTNSFLSTSIEYLKGVGPKRAEILKKELRIFTYDHLLTHFPFRYIDRSKVHKISEVKSDESYVQLKGKISNVKEAGTKGGKRLIAYLQDETGVMELIWFKGAKWIKPKLIIGKEFIVFGKPSQFNSSFNLVHPDLEEKPTVTDIVANLQPVYSSTDLANATGLNTKGIEKLTKTLVSGIKNQIPETLPQSLIQELKLMPRERAYREIHHPQSADLLKKAIFRLKFEEFFFLQLRLLKQKIIQEQKLKGFVFEKVGESFNQFFTTKLPFELTNAQKRVVKEIRVDVGSGKHMNRLLQGDVGSGKTLVGLLAMLIAKDNGFQSLLMAPTEILAIQHYATISGYLEGTGVTVALLTGSSKKSERAVIHEQLLSGELDLLIGTHALLEDIVQFKNLGLAIIDEQHRFGVKQRSKLWKKNNIPPHILVMTATPIPRTLAMTVYGDLDISVIDELPPGRKEISTTHKFDKDRLYVFKFMEKQIAEGRQVYVVYPLIEESEHLDFKDLMDGYESMARRFPLPNYKLSIVHGKMKAKDKEYEMQQFAKGFTNIMVATTVIEVGVNVPNATVMVIESANKFGLSQLHQLRGRVGRGSDKSYCVLMTDYKLSPTAKTRIETMVRTNDGFEIAEEDLKLRGPGDILGTQQSGILDLKLGDLIKDKQIVVAARNIATELLKQDPDLSLQENYLVRQRLAYLIKLKPNWGRIS